ncbi:MAG: class I SAM-dependent methyltransferase [Euryarchaeota archaeon]|nr:class I SAM-dependent methyltransferase [Euryarchaeota archaeon]
MTGRTKELNWREAWAEMQKQRGRSLRIGYDPEFRDKFAEDSSEIAKHNNYEYGRKATEALSGRLDDNFEVLEIGAGPGTLTIPLAENVKRIVVIEASGTAVNYLKRNTKECLVENVEIVNKNWLDVDEHKIKDGFDLVVCSHFLWQVTDLERHLEKMEHASNKYCAVIQPVGRDSIVKEIWTVITGEDYRGEFDPDADYFAYQILRQWGRLVNVRIMNYSTERNFEQELRYIASFIGKYVEVDTSVKKIIEQYVRKKGLWKEEHSAVVMWWRIPSYIPERFQKGKNNSGYQNDA